MANKTKHHGKKIYADFACNVSAPQNCFRNL